MQDIKVHRYQYPSDYVGWIEPEDRTWIAFIRKDGIPIFYLDRDPESGAVLTDEDAHVPYPGWIKRGSEDGWLADPQGPESPTDIPPPPLDMTN